MQVKNKLTGDTTHVKNNDATIQALIKLGILVVVDDTPAPGEWVRTQNGAVIPAGEAAPVPRWYVGTMSAGSTDNLGRAMDAVKIPCVVFEVGTTIFERFCGTPENLKDGHAFGRTHCACQHYRGVRKRRTRPITKPAQKKCSRPWLRP